MLAGHPHVSSPAQQSPALPGQGPAQDHESHQVGRRRVRPRRVGRQVGQGRPPPRAKDSQETGGRKEKRDKGKGRARSDGDESGWETSDAGDGAFDAPQDDPGTSIETPKRPTGRPRASSPAFPLGPIMAPQQSTPGPSNLPQLPREASQRAGNPGTWSEPGGSKTPQLNLEHWLSAKQRHWMEGDLVFEQAPPTVTPLLPGAQAPVAPLDPTLRQPPAGPQVCFFSVIQAKLSSCPLLTFLFF